jgi:hypothetical protein
MRSAPRHRAVSHLSRARSTAPGRPGSPGEPPASTPTWRLPGELFLLDGLGIQTLRAAEDFLIMHALNPGAVGAVRAAIEARLAAPGTNGRRPAPAAEWGLSDVPRPAGPTEL